MPFLPFDDCNMHFASSVPRGPVSDRASCFFDGTQYTALDQHRNACSSWWAAPKLSAFGIFGDTEPTATVHRGKQQYTSFGLLGKVANAVSKAIASAEPGAQTPCDTSMFGGKKLFCGQLSTYLATLCVPRLPKDFAASVDPAKMEPGIPMPPGWQRGFVRVNQNLAGARGETLIPDGLQQSLSPLKKKKLLGKKMHWYAASGMRPRARDKKGAFMKCEVDDEDSSQWTCAYEDQEGHAVEELEENLETSIPDADGEPTAAMVPSAVVDSGKGTHLAMKCLDHKGIGVTLPGMTKVERACDAEKPACISPSAALRYMQTHPAGALKVDCNASNDPSCQVFSMSQENAKR